MKKALFLVMSLALLIASGCATEGYVKDQLDPLCKRVSDLEAKVAGIESRLNQMPTSAGMSEADKAALQKADESAKESAAKAEDAAKRAEAAAKEAELAAKKGAKLLELEQKK
ncbi:MAG TPA: hypothetical protein VF799_11780 [Geobacteraceae bacterium]